jgi:trans-aconitate methyltransferase
MRQQEAIQLISAAAIDKPGPQQWADLGCGSGTFTDALAHLLPEGSTIYAIDKSRQQLPPTVHGVEIVFRQGDFERDNLPLNNLHGILLANALHYCKDAKGVLEKLARLQMANKQQFLIVEYDSTLANRWVPYPLPFEKIKSIFLELGWHSVVKLGEHPSKFRSGNMYACQAIIS